MSIIKFNCKNKEGKRSKMSVFVISENEDYITGIKLDNLPDTDVKLIKERFKNRIPDNEITSKDQRIKKLKKISGMEENWINASATFKKLNNKTNYKRKIELNYYESQEIEKKAEKLVKEGKYTEAIEYYTKLVEAKPHNLNYKNKIKKLEIIKENKKEAEDNYHKAIELEKQGKYKEAIKFCKKATKLDPNNTKYKNKLQELKSKEKTKNKEKAKQYYEKALTLKKEGNYKEAIKCCKKATKLDPKNKEYKKKKEELILRVKNKKIGIAYYKQAKDWYVKALKYMRIDRYEYAKNCFKEAIKGYNKAIKNFDSKKDKDTIIRLYEEIIKILLKERKCPEVIEYYNEIIRLKPSYPEYYQKKRDRIKNKIKKQAENWYIKALKFAQIGQYEDAIYCCRQAIKLDPKKKYCDEIQILDIKIKERNENEKKSKKHRKDLHKDTIGRG